MKCESIRRKRLPRGRHIAKSVAGKGSGSTNDKTTRRDTLKKKIDRLEALINVALSEADGKGGSGDAGETTSSAAATTEKVVSRNGNQGSEGFEPRQNVLASHFWSSVITEVFRESRGFAGDDTEGDDDDEDDEESEGENEEAKGERVHLAQEPARAYLPFMGLSLGRLGHTLPHSLTLRPSPAITAALCDIYLNQIDRIIKVLHRPSLQRHLLEGIPYPSSSLKSKSSREAENALDTAVFYAAVASMTDRQCHNLFQCSRNEVLPEYQSACEMALERADLMRTTDMMVLQAFVLYLVCL